MLAALPDRHRGLPGGGRDKSRRGDPPPGPSCSAGWTRSRLSRRSSRGV